MKEWLDLVAAPPFPTDEQQIVSLARQAKQKLDTMALVLKESPTSARILELLSLVLIERPAVTSAELREPEIFFGVVWPLWVDGDATPLAEVLGANPPRTFHSWVTEGRGDLGFLYRDSEDEDDDSGPSAPPDHVLANESVREWVFLWHAGDGHQALFWDPTSKGDVRLLWIDNREPEVIVHEFNPEEFLRRRVFPDLISRHRDDVEGALRSPLVSTARDAAACGGIAALFIVTILLLGVVVVAARACIFD